MTSNDDNQYIAEEVNIWTESGAKFRAFFGDWAKRTSGNKTAVLVERPHFTRVSRN